MKELIRTLYRLIDEIPEDIKIYSVYDGTVQIRDGVNRIAKIFKTEVDTVKRDSEIYPYQFETVINGVKFFELIEEISALSQLTCSNELDSAPKTGSTTPKDLSEELFDLLLSRNAEVQSMKILYSKGQNDTMKILVTVEYGGRDDRIIYDRSLKKQDVTRIMSYEPKSFTTKLGRLLIQLIKLYPYKESIVLRRQNRESIQNIKVEENS